MSTEEENSAVTPGTDKKPQLMLKETYEIWDMSSNGNDFCRWLSFIILQPSWTEPYPQGELAQPGLHPTEENHG